MAKFRQGFSEFQPFRHTGSQKRIRLAVFPMMCSYVYTGSLKTRVLSSVSLRLGSLQNLVLLVQYNLLTEAALFEGHMTHTLICALPEYSWPGNITESKAYFESLQLGLAKLCLLFCTPPGT